MAQKPKNGSSLAVAIVATYLVALLGAPGLTGAQPSGSEPAPTATPSSGPGAPAEARPRPEPPRPTGVGTPRGAPSDTSAPSRARPSTASPAPAVAPAPARATTPARAATADGTKGPGNAAARPSDRDRLEQKNKKRRKTLERLLSMFQFSTVWYLQYRYGATRTDGPDETYNRFFVGRGYLTMKVTPTKWFEARITMDTHQDGEGDWKVRLKYLYGKFKLPVETAVITEPYAEFGIAHIPWLDYEEHINYYRMQGTMFVERNKLHNSADLGLTLGALLGRKLPKAYQKKVNKKYPGEWGSLAVGVYNGAGYHAAEINENKTVEGRLSVRPGGPYFPNVQLSYFFVWGKGGTRMEPATPGDPEYPWPDWQNNILMVSFEHQYLVATAQVAFGRGSQKGDSGGWLDDDGQSRSYRGASAFLEVKLPWIRSSLWGRYDWWDGPYGGMDKPYHRFISAFAFHFWGRNKNVLMVDFEYLKFDDGDDPAARDDQWAVTFTCQIKL